MPGNGALIAQGSQAPGARRLCVGECFERREALRAHDEKGFLWLEVAGCFNEIGPIDIGYEAQLKARFAVVAQRLIGHHRTQVRSPDADVDHVADTFARVAEPSAASNLSGERRHAIERCMHVLDDVDAVKDDPLARRSPQRRVQRGTFLAAVDQFAAKHRGGAPR